MFQQSLWNTSPFWSSRLPEQHVDLQVPLPLLLQEATPSLHTRSFYNASYTLVHVHLHRSSSTPNVANIASKGCPISALISSSSGTGESNVLKAISKLSSIASVESISVPSKSNNIIIFSFFLYILTSSLTN